MLKVSVKLIGRLKGLVNRDNVVVELEESSLKALFTFLIERYGGKFKHVLMGSNTCDPEVNNIILVNDVEIGILEGLETKLHENDLVTIIPVTHGG